MGLRLSIPRRVFLGFSLVLTVSVILSLASVVQHQRTATSLRMLEDGYLPLALMVSEGRATQSVLSNLLDRIMTERNSASSWAFVNAGRRGRPRMLKKALASVAELEKLAPPAVDREALSRVRRDLKRVQTTLHQTTWLYERLKNELEAGHRDVAKHTLDDLRARERVVDGRLRSAWTIILSRINGTSAAAADEQQRFMTILGVLGAVALLIGIAVTWWAGRMLSPLPKLQARVEAVARGDLASQPKMPSGDDEIGRLAQEFEAMVVALIARDKRLGEASDNQRRLQQMQAQILEELSAAVLVIDERGFLLSQNPAAARLLAVGSGHVGVAWTQTGLADALPELPAMVDTVSSSGQAETRQERSVAPTASDGSPRLLNLLVTPFGPEGDGASRRKVLVVAEDVTDAVRTKARLIQTERLAAIGRMAAHVTHEVRNPLSSIGLNVELLEDELQGAGPEAAELLSAIQREIERLGALTDEYLRVARLPTPALEVDSLVDTVVDTCRFMARELDAVGVELVVDVEPGVPDVALDEGQIRQVLINLINNGRDAMPDGGQLHVGIRAEGGGVRLLVADHGVGIEESERSQIFDLFYTTKKLGTGLGLPLTQQIVLAHGGTIVCRSASGQGTEFELRFPAVVAADVPGVARPNRPTGHSGGGTQVGAARGGGVALSGRSSGRARPSGGRTVSPDDADPAASMESVNENT